jgi:hypothetical protein
MTKKRYVLHSSTAPHETHRKKKKFKNVNARYGHKKYTGGDIAIGTGKEAAKFGAIVAVDRGLRKGAKYAKRAGRALMQRGRDLYRRARGDVSIRNALEQNEPLNDAPAGEELVNAADPPGARGPIEDEIVDDAFDEYYDYDDIGNLFPEEEAAVMADAVDGGAAVVNEGAAVEMGAAAEFEGLTAGGLAEGLGIAEGMAAGGVPLLGEAMMAQMVLQGVAGGLGMLREYGRDSHAPASKYQPGFVQDPENKQQYEYDNRVIKGLDWEKKTHEVYNGPFGWIEKQINDPFNEIMDDFNHKDTWKGIGNLLTPHTPKENLNTIQKGVEWVGGKFAESITGPRYQAPIDITPITSNIRISGGK